MNVNKYRIFFFCFLWVGCSGWAFSQNDKIIEALQVNYTSCKTDTGKVNILLQIANLTKDNDSSILYSRNALNISLKNNFITGIALSYKKLGNCYLNKNDHTKAIEYFTSAIKYFDETGDKSGIGKCYYNIGLIYYNQSNFAKALEYKLKALKLFEEISDKELIARSYTDIGDIYYSQKNYGKATDYKKNYSKALEYFNKALIICDTLKDVRGLARNYNNIGLIYIEEKDYTKAFEYILRALKIYEKIGNKYGIGVCYINIANIYQYTNNYQMAMQYYKNALKIKEENGDKKDIGVCYINIGSLNNYLNNYKEAITYSLKGIEIAKEVNDFDNLKTGYGILKDAYKGLGDYKKAYAYQLRYISLRDSIFDIESTKQMSDLKTNFEVEKKESEMKTLAKAEQEKLAVVTEAEKKRQSTIIYFVIFILIIVSIASGFLFNRFKITQRQKNIIEKQKDVVQIQKQKVEEKNKEILDSIQYAKRLQNAILPKSKFVKEYLQESFIFYRPKDIVAGDFYWIYPTKNEKEETIILFAAADCTGHGVPGAMVSVVCANALNRAVKEKGLQNPGKILDTVSKLVIETFVQKDSSTDLSDTEVSDGMDISLCALNLTTLQLQWSGANNPLMIVKNNATEITEYKPNKQPVGLYENPHPFTAHSLDLEKGDMIYIFSDGYADQFGGERGRKLMRANFNKQLLKMATLNVAEQLQQVEYNFENWKGNQQQVDDICVIGVRV